MLPSGAIKDFADVTRLMMSKWTFNAMTYVFARQRKREIRHRREGDAAMKLTPGEATSQKMPVANKKRHGSDSHPEPLEEGSSANTLIYTSKMRRLPDTGKSQCVS